MRKFFLTMVAVCAAALCFTGCPSSASDDSDSVPDITGIANFAKYTAIGVGSRNGSRAIRAVGDVTYVDASALVGELEDGTYEVVKFTTEDGETEITWYVNYFASYTDFISVGFSETQPGNVYGTMNWDYATYHYILNRDDGKLYSLDNYLWVSPISEGTDQFCFMSTVKDETDEELNYINRAEFEDSKLKITTVFDVSGFIYGYDVSSPEITPSNIIATNRFIIFTDNTIKYFDTVKNEVIKNIDNDIYLDGYKLLSDGTLDTEFRFNLIQLSNVNLLYTDNNISYYIGENSSRIYKAVLADEKYYISWIGTSPEINLGYNDKYLYYYTDGNIKKYDITYLNDEPLENYMNISLDEKSEILYSLREITSASIDSEGTVIFSGIDFSYNTVSGYIKADGTISTDITTYTQPESKILYITALN